MLPTLLPYSSYVGVKWCVVHWCHAHPSHPWHGDDTLTTSTVAPHHQCLSLLVSGEPWYIPIELTCSYIREFEGVQNPIYKHLARLRQWVKAAPSKPLTNQYFRRPRTPEVG
jgi:hypothetical protein